MIAEVYQKNYGVWLAVDEAGELYTMSSQAFTWEPVLFQQQYTGYYPECRFKHILATRKEFIAVAAGMDGRPYAYRSMTGNVWEPIILKGKSREGIYREAVSEIVAVLYHSKSNQVFFVCENGELITMPDCPECMKIQKASYEKLRDAGWQDGEEKYMILVSASGKEQVLDTSQASQYQVTFSYAKEHQNQGYWVWLGGKNNRLESEGCRGKQIRLDFDQLFDWMNMIKKEEVIYFACENGTRSELAAYLARKKGFENTYFVAL